MIICFRIGKETVFRMYSEKHIGGGLICSFEFIDPYEKYGLGVFGNMDEATSAARTVLKKRYTKWEEFPTYDKERRIWIPKWNRFNAGSKENGMFGIDGRKFRSIGCFYDKEAYYLIEGPSEEFREYMDKEVYRYFYRPKTQIPYKKPQKTAIIPVFNIFCTNDCRGEKAPSDGKDELKSAAISFRKRYDLNKGDVLPKKALKDPDVLFYFKKNGLIKENNGSFYWNG